MWGILKMIKGHDIYGRIFKGESEYRVEVPAVGEHSAFVINIPIGSVLYRVDTTEDIVLRKLKSSYALMKVFSNLFSVGF